MEKVSFEKRQINKNGEFTATVLDCSQNKKITIQEGENLDIFVNDFSHDISLDIDIKENAKLNIALLCKNNANNSKITAKVAQNSKISLYFADFSSSKNNVNVVVDLEGNNAQCDWHLSSLSSKNDEKEFSIFINHNHPQTFASSDNYGVCKDSGKLVFSGTSAIYKGNVKSETKQNAKIMVFDEDCSAAARPILKIDENDLLASHSAVVGKINDEHLFYLTSRGLKENEAKRLITYGYLKPIVKGFIDESIQDEIISLIEEKIS